MTYTLGRNLRYAVNSTAAGTGTWTIVTVATNVAVGNSLNYVAKLAVHNGKPVIAYPMENGDHPAIGYAMSATALGTGSWTPYTLTPGSYLGTLMVYSNRPLVVHHGIGSDLRITRWYGRLSFLMECLAGTIQRGKPRMDTNVRTARAQKYPRQHSLFGE